MRLPFGAEGPMTWDLCPGGGRLSRGGYLEILLGLRSNPRWKSKTNSNRDVWRENLQQNGHIWWNLAIGDIMGLMTKNRYFYWKFVNLLTAPMSPSDAVNQATEVTYSRVKAQKFWCNLCERFGRYRPKNSKNAQFWPFFGCFLAFWAKFFGSSTFSGLPKITVQIVWCL